MGKITRTWSMMSACSGILREEKSLLIFPFISGTACLLLLASFAIPLYHTGHWQPPARTAEPAQQVLYYSVLFLFYALNYFIVVFFNACVVAWAMIRMKGGNPTIGDGFRAAITRLPVIVGWAVVSATVGLLLRIIEDRSEKVGRFVAGLLGAGWTVVSFLVVPILVVENMSPLAALKESTQLLKKTWGEQLAGNFSFGLIFALLALPGIAAVILAAMSGKAAVLIACIVLAVLYLIGLGMVQSTLQSIFQAVVYLYARNGQLPEGFDAELLGNAMSSRS